VRLHAFALGRSLWTWSGCGAWKWKLFDATGIALWSNSTFTAAAVDAGEHGYQVATSALACAIRAAEIDRVRSMCNCSHCHIRRPSQGPNSLRITSQLLPAPSGRICRAGPIVVGKGDDVALRRAHPWQLSKQHDGLPVADQ
jgi:hypothetical protein